jgi:hypothetical protein
MATPANLPAIGGPLWLDGYEESRYIVGKFGGAYYWRRLDDPQWYGSHTSEAKAACEASQETASPDRSVARWQSPRPDWIELWQTAQGVYYYTGFQCAGCLGEYSCDEAAIARMESPENGPVAAHREVDPTLERVARE